MKKLKLVSVQMELKNPESFPKGFVDLESLARVTEVQILAHEKEDDLAWEKQFLSLLDSETDR